MTNDFDIGKARSDLVDLRKKHGHDSAMGHRASNLIVQLENLEGATGDQRANLLKSISRSLSEIGVLQR